MNMIKILKPLNTMLKNIAMKKAIKAKKDFEYKNLLEKLVTNGLVQFNGKTYYSIADLTISFYEEKVFLNEKST
ncbi:hypothetical protein ACF3OC_08525 [Sphingobacterium cellulitidis]|uniref:hypothetical protein n=1 Tax=Sphingobacterium cellulitidis TaxID=1768011 RepID=UPI00370D6E05